MKDKRIKILVILLLIASLLMHILSKEMPEADELEGLVTLLKKSSKWQGKTAPDFSARLMDGGIFRISDVVGKKMIIINFFATWCGPCKDEMPELNRYYEENKGEDIILIGIDADEGEEVVKRFIDNLNITFPVVIDNGGKIQNSYGVNSYPTTVVIGINGKIMLYELGKIINADVSFHKLFEENRKMLRVGKGVKREEYLAMEKKEDYSGVKDEIVLTGRALHIANIMDCSCGCDKKVKKCTCKTARGIKKRLLEAFWTSAMTDTDIIKQLNKEFCVGVKKGDAAGT